MLVASSQIMQTLPPAIKSPVQQVLIVPPEAFLGAHQSQPIVASISILRQFLVPKS
jgi:hypothetical protein